MKELFDKISSYNIFNYLLPGVVFVCIAKYFLQYNFVQENDLIGAFLYYFIGMIISRFGSVVIEPISRKFRIVEFAEYGDFISASKQDNKIELLSEVNNTSRTLISLFFILLVLKGYESIEIHLKIPQQVSLFISIILILILFIFSYRKQTAYITKRIHHYKSNTN